MNDIIIKENGDMVIINQPQVPVYEILEAVQNEVEGLLNEIGAYDVRTAIELGKRFASRIEVMAEPYEAHE